MKIYLASSWRNPNQPDLVQHLRAIGHEVYDFKNPEPGDDGFSWSEVDPAWTTWSPPEFIRGLEHPVAQRGFHLDFDAMKWADACVLLLPCGRSAHLEAGWCAGQGKPTIVYAHTLPEPELMYLLCDTVVYHWDQLVDALKSAEGLLVPRD